MGNEAPPPEKGRREANARLRELLAIPERLRSDAEWDEIVEIEISQAPTKSEAKSAAGTGAPGNTPRPARREPRARPAKPPVAGIQGEPGKQGSGNRQRAGGGRPPGAGKQGRKRRP